MSDPPEQPFQRTRARIRGTEKRDASSRHLPDTQSLSDSEDDIDSIQRPVKRYKLNHLIPESDRDFSCETTSRMDIENLIPDEPEANQSCDLLTPSVQSEERVTDLIQPDVTPSWQSEDEVAVRTLVSIHNDPNIDRELEMIEVAVGLHDPKVESPSIPEQIISDEVCSQVPFPSLPSVIVMQ